MVLLSILGAGGYAAYDANARPSTGLLARYAPAAQAALHVPFVADRISTDGRGGAGHASTYAAEEVAKVQRLVDEAKAKAQEEAEAAAAADAAAEAPQEEEAAQVPAEEPEQAADEGAAEDAGAAGGGLDAGAGDGASGEAAEGDAIDDAASAALQQDAAPAEEAAGGDGEAGEAAAVVQSAADQAKAAVDAALQEAKDAAAEEAKREADAEADRLRRSQQHLDDLNALVSQIKEAVGDSREEAQVRSAEEVVQLLRRDLADSFAKDVEAMSETDLRERLIKLTNELRDRGKWEAIRMNEALSRQDDVWTLKMVEAMKEQAHTFQDRIDEIRREETDRANLEITRIRDRLEREFTDRMEAMVAERVSSLVEEESQRLQKAFQENEELRAKAVEELHAKAAAMARVAEKRAEYERVSHRVHKMSLALLSLSAALNSSGRATEEVEALRVAAEGDPLIEAALDSLPKSVFRSGAPTAHAVQQRFLTVYKAGRRAALVPKDSGLLGHYLGAISSLLLVTPESSSEAVEQADDPTSGLTRASAALNAGDLALAVKEVESLDGYAADTCRDWLAAAKERLRVLQTLQVLEAHVGTVVASMY